MRRTIRIPVLSPVPVATLLLAVLIGGTGLLLTPPALAQTQPLPDPEANSIGPTVTGPAGSTRVAWPTHRVNWLLELDRTVDFLDVWQYRTPGTNFGGMIEAEGGPLGGVIQTDNTLEAIWVWSHYRLLTGDTSYDDNIHDAWIYCQNFPAWLEEGGNGYYRVHNCAWALTAESAYRAATGDTTFMAYGRTSAEYIKNTPLFLNQLQRLNAMVQGWAAGNLYLYAEELANETWRQKALDYGETMIDWIAVNPATNLAFETWAMSAGTIVWGICNSTFRADQPRGALWIENYGALVDTFQVWYNVPNDGYDWDNSWNVAYLNAHFAMGDVSGDPHYTRMGEKLTRQLNSYDTDDDGGIQATTQDPETIDMSWVSCYLAKFGYARMVGTPPETDAGLLEFTTLHEGDVFYLGEGPAVPIRVAATNFGLLPLTGVEVHLAGADTGSAVVDLPFVGLEEVELSPGWLPSVPGVHEFLAWTTVAGDEDVSNDTLTVRVSVIDPAAVDDGPGGSSADSRRVSIAPNPSRGGSLITFAAPPWQDGHVELFALDGRQVRGWPVEAGVSRTLRFTWDGRDASGQPAPAGIYFVRAEWGGKVETRKLVRLGD